jgi:hypothetical protein
VLGSAPPHSPDLFGSNSMLIGSGSALMDVGNRSAAMGLAQGGYTGLALGTSGAVRAEIDAGIGDSITPTPSRRIQSCSGGNCHPRTRWTTQDPPASAASNVHSWKPGCDNSYKSDNAMKA